VVHAALRAIAPIRSHLFWRAFYRLLRTRLAVHAAARLLGQDGLETLANTFVWTGWPHRARRWINLDLSRFVARAQRVDAAAPLPRRPHDVRTPPAVVCIGNFVRQASFGAPEFFAAAAEICELHVVDVAADGAFAAYIADHTASYVTAPLREQPARAAAAVNAAAADILVVYTGGREVYELLDHVTTPCVIHQCTGSDLIHHERVSFFLHGQPEADYIVVGERIFCGTSRAWFGAERVFPVGAYYDGAAVGADVTTPWDDRSPLIFYHGSVYKLGDPTFLDVVLRLLVEDPELEFAFMGRGDRDDIEVVNERARRHGVADRVHYDGAFSPVRGRDGTFDEEAVARLRAHLARARLAPNPWPMGGGSARVEAYGMRVPTAHLALRTDAGSFGRPQPTIVDVPALRVAAATVDTIDDYARLCDRLLHDADAATTVIAAQLEVFRRVTDPVLYWRDLFRCYDEWRRGYDRQR
jgi:hypothetical protein